MNNDILEKFTTHLKSVLVRAYTLAHELSQEHISPEHLLWALLTEKGSIGSEILQKLKISPDTLRENVASKPRTSSPEGVPVLTAATKRVIEKAVLTATLYEHKYVGTEHLLAGLLQIEDVGVEALLETYAIDRKHLRNQLSTVLKSASKFPELAEGLETSPGVPPAGERAAVFPGRAEPMTKSTKKKTPALDFFTIDLTSDEAQKRIDPVIGRDAEIERMIQILSRRTKNNPALLGDPGVGKTAIVEGLAKRIASHMVPKTLQGKRILALDLPLLLAGTMYRGEFEGRLKQVIEEVKAHPEVILFIDEMHTISGAGSASGSMDAADILKPALARGEIHCIGATTPEEYKKHVEGDAALERRFQAVQVREPSPAETRAILGGLRERYAAFHSVTITDAALDAAVKFGERYLTGRFFPDKAIDLLDEAAAMVRVRESATPEEQRLAELDSKLKELRGEKHRAVLGEQFVQALELKEKESSLAVEAGVLRSNLDAEERRTERKVTEADVALVVSRSTGIPASELVAAETARLLNLEAELGERVVGQDEVVRAVAEYVRRAHAGLTDPKRPLASFLFMGPSGVGKTELAKAIAEAAFGGAEALIRLDMSEFSESHTISKMVGSPAGYVGYRDATKLTDQIKRRPFAVVLFDEVEKAHPDVLNLLLQILEDGALTDSTGRQVSFHHAVVVLTSNVGLERFLRGPVGFTNTQSQDLAKEVAKEAEQIFRPELLNRLDRIFVFRQLDTRDLERVVAIQFRILADRILPQGIALELGPGVLAYLARKAAASEQGARVVRRLLQDEIESKLAERILGTHGKREQIRVTLRAGALTIGPKASRVPAKRT